MAVADSECLGNFFGGSSLQPTQQFISAGRMVLMTLDVDGHFSADLVPRNYLFYIEVE